MKPLILPKRVSQQHIQVEHQASPSGLVLAFGKKSSADTGPVG